MVIFKFHRMVPTVDPFPLSILHSCLYVSKNSSITETQMQGIAKDLTLNSTHPCSNFGHHRPKMTGQVDGDL